MKCNLCNEPIVDRDFVIVVAADLSEKCYHRRCDPVIIKAQATAAVTKQYGFSPKKKSKPLQDSELGEFE